MAELVTPLTTTNRRLSIVPSPTASTTEAGRRDHSPDENAKDNGKKEPESQAPPETLEALPLAIPKPTPAAMSDEAAAGVSQTLIHLFSLFREQRSNLLKWLGGRSYEAIVRKQKKTPRRGTILDKKIE